MTVQPGLCQTWSETQIVCFSHAQAHLILSLVGLIIICTLLGMATAKVGEAGRPFIQFFKATSDIVIQALRWLIW